METVKLKFPFFDGRERHPVGAILTREDGVLPKSAKRLTDDEIDDQMELPLELKTFSEMNKKNAEADLISVDGPTSLSELAPSTNAKARKAKSKK